MSGYHQMPNWQVKKDALKRAGKPIPTEGPGVQVFRNAVSYFR